MSIILTDSIAVKYRPKTFSDIVGNKKNISVISGYFKQGKLVKSWMLSGASGSGKTTTARIMAMAVNCQGMKDGEYEPCMKCNSCKAFLSGHHPDIKEINAGSEEGRVSGIESILETVKYRPRYNAKVFIIDEAHLMSNKASQSLLKVLEEPPSGVMWIIATTDPHKLPQAILGRCVKLFFEYPATIDTAKRLLKIAKIEYNKEVITKIKPYLIPIAESTQSQVRNSLSVLESVANIVISNPNINEKQLKTMFKDILMDLGDVSALAIRYITYLLNDSYGLPLAISNDLEQSRIDEFISVTTRHSHYASTYFAYSLTSNLGLKEFYKVRSKFYGVNFQRFDNALEKMQEKLLNKGHSKSEIIAKSLSISNSLIATLEKLRLGIIAKDQAIVYGIGLYSTPILKGSE